MEQWVKLQADCSNFEDVWYLRLENPKRFRHTYHAALIHHDLMVNTFTLDIMVSPRCMGPSYYDIPIKADTLADAKKEAEKWCGIGYFTIKRMLREMKEGVAVEVEDQNEDWCIQLG